jgi:xylose isomerase
MEDHLRFAVAYWHSFTFQGGDPFGGQTLLRPWFGDDMALARMKADVAFELFDILGVPFYCFHDADVRPEGRTFSESKRNLDEIVDYLAAKQDRHKTRLLWGTANMFSHRRWMAGAATNPDPDVFAYAAATVKANMDATHRLGGANYVLWGGREGYETLLNTDLKAERDHASCNRSSSTSTRSASRARSSSSPSRRSRQSTSMTTTSPRFTGSSCSLGWKRK